MAELFDGDFDRDAARLSERLDGFAGDPDGLRDAFLARHVHALYAQLTHDGTDGLRADDLVYAAAEHVPGLTPDPRAGRARARAAPEGQGGLRDRAGRVPRRRARRTRSRPAPDRGDAAPDAARARPPRRASSETGRVDLGTATVEPRRATSASSSCATRATSTPRTTRRPARSRPRSTSSCSTTQVEIACCAAASSSTRATRAGASSAPA